MDAASPPRGPRRRVRQLALVAAVLLGQLLVGIASPAAACACGAIFDPVGERTESRVLQETAVLSLRDGIETIVMGLALDAARTGSTLLMPTPSVPTVSDAQSGTLREMAAATAPREVVELDLWGPTPFLAGAGGPGDGAAPGESATVHEQSRIGDYEVAVLEGGAAQVRSWLAENGYELSDEVAPLVDPYADEGWVFTAVRYAPDAVLSGDVAPLRFDFATDELVYPMRFSQAAQSEQSVHLFVLSDQPVRRTDYAADAQRTTRPWIGDPARHSWEWSDTTLRELVGEDLPRTEDGLRERHGVVTEFEIHGAPESFTSDLRFATDPEAESVIPTYAVTEVTTVLGIPVGYWLVLFGAVTSAAVLIAVRSRWQLRKERTRAVGAAH